jgi:hypothetical protein
MYQFSKRLEGYSVEYDVELLDVVSARARALLAAINALSLVGDCSWITVPGVSETRVVSDEFGMDDIDMGVKSAGKTTMRILTLGDLKREYSLALAKLTLGRCLPEFADSYSVLSAGECVELYAKCGLYKAAADICGLFGLEYTGVFKGVVKGGDWDVVKDFLGRFDGEDSGWKYHVVVLEAVMKEREGKMPRWFIAALKEHKIQDLLRVYVRYGLLEESVRIATEFLEGRKRVVHTGLVAGAGSRWIPMGVIGSVVRVCGDGGVEVVGLKEAVCGYLAVVEREGRIVKGN